MGCFLLLLDHGPLQVLNSAVLMRDLVLHKLVKLACAMHLSFLLLKHLGLQNDALLLLAITLLLSALIADALLCTGLRVQHEALDAAWDLFLNAKLSVLPLQASKQKLS